MGMDSVSAIKLTSLIKNETKVDIPISLLYSPQQGTIGSITKYLSSQQQNQNQQQGTAIYREERVDWKKELTLNPELLQLIKETMISTADTTNVGIESYSTQIEKPANILVTGVRFLLINQSFHYHFYCD